MANIKFIRAKEDQVPAYSDGQLILTDEGNGYVDFPNHTRVHIGNNNATPTINLLELLEPSALNVEYSTQGTGWLVQIIDNNKVQLARKYFTQGVPTSWEHYSIPFTTNGTGSYVTVNIRKAAEDASYVPGDFAFDNFQCAIHGQTEEINLLKNGDFENRLNGWNISEKFANQCRVAAASPTLNREGWVLSIEVPDSSAKYGTILDQTVSALPNTPYEFSMWTYNMAPSSTAQARVYFFDQNGNEIHKWTADAGKAFTTTFTTGADVTAIKVAIRGNLQYLADDMILKLKIPQIKNGDFSQGVTDWETCSTYNSDYVPEEILEENGNKSIRTRCDQIGPDHTSAAFIKQTHIYVQKNVTYSLEFDIKRLSESTVWQPYTTIMDDDKLRLMTSNGKATNEYPKFGGPWANSLHYDYILRSTITKPENIQCDVSHLGILTNIISSKGSEILIDYSKDGENWTSAGRQLFDENVEWADEVEDSFKVIPLKKVKNNDFNYLRVTITFQGDSELVKEDLKPTENFLKGLRLYGQSFTIPNEIHPLYCQDIQNNAYYPAAIIAPQFIGNIDDGSIDWRDL